MHYSLSSRLCLLLLTVTLLVGCSGSLSAQPVVDSALESELPTASIERTEQLEEHLVGIFPSNDVRTYFPIGVFEDANIIGGNTTRFETMLTDMRSRGLDTILFTNNFIDRDAPLLEVSDRVGANIFMLPSGDFYENWWPETVPANRETALAVAQPAVERFSRHPSMKGYIVKDEPALRHMEKVVLMTEALRELDPQRPVNTTLIGIPRVGPIFEAARPDVMQIDVYPAGLQNELCDFRMTGFGYPQLDFIDYIRTVTQNRPPDTPLWIILQTHSFDLGGASLREPTASEVRMQQWLALGEGATGIFWFVYSTQQSWTGLVDNETLYTEVTDLTRRLRPLRSLLLGLHKVEDAFTVTSAQPAYASTLRRKHGSSTFVVAVNRDCLQPQALTIKSPVAEGQLRDVETGQIYELGAPIPFRPGDGRIFQLVNVELFLPKVTHEE